MSVTTGAHKVWVYRWEDENEFNQDPGAPTDTANKIFGANETMSSADRSQNPERMFRPFRRSAETIIETNFEGSWGAEFVLTNTLWLEFFFGPPEDTGAELIYEMDPQEMPRSAHLIEETHWPNGEIEQTVYTGCASGSVDFDVSVEDTVQVTIDGLYATEHNFEDVDGADPDSSPYGVIGDQPALQFRPLHFGNSILRVDLDNDGTAEAQRLVQDASISLEGNLEGAHELGTRFVVAPQHLAFEPDLDYTRLSGIPNQNEEQRASAYGEVDAKEPQETLHNADISSELEFATGDPNEQNEITLKASEAFPEDFNRSNIGSPEDAIEDDVTRMVTNLTVEVVSDDVNFSLTAETLQPTNITDTEAQLNGEVGSFGDGTQADVWFEWREQGASSWNTTTTQTITTAGAYDDAIDGLTADTQYEYRAIAENTEHGQQQGAIESFTTQVSQIIESFEHNDLAAHYNGDTASNFGIVDETSVTPSAQHGTLLGELSLDTSTGTLVSVDTEFDNLLGPDGSGEIDFYRADEGNAGPFLFLIGVTSDDETSYNAVGIEFSDDGTTINVGPTSDASPQTLDSTDDSSTSHTISNGNWYTFTVSRDESAGEVTVEFVDDTATTIALTATTNTTGSGHGFEWDTAGRWFIDRFEADLEEVVTDGGDVVTTDAGETVFASGGG